MDDREEHLDKVAAGVDVVQRYTGPARTGLKSGLPLVNPVAEPGAEPRISGVDEDLLAGLGVLDHDQTDLREGVVRAVDHPQRNDFVPVCKPDERTFPLSGADEVRDHHNQAAPGQGRDRVEHRGEVGGLRHTGFGSAIEFPSDPQRMVRPVPGGMMRAVPALVSAVS